MFRDTDNLQDVFDCEGWVMCINDDGVAHPVYGLPIIHARLIQAATITADKYAELRNTYVYTFNEPGVDSSHPAEFPFKIVSEMTSIQSVKLSFRIMSYRAYSTGAESGGGSSPTSADGGSGRWDTTGPANWTLGAATEGPSTQNTTSDDPGDTEYYDIGTHYHNMPSHDHDVTGRTENEDCGGGSHSHDLSYNAGTSSEDPGNTFGPSAYNRNHKHGMGTHNHGLSSHTHDLDGSGSDHTHELNLPNHTHTVTIANHEHNISYGIHEESNSPTVHFHINNGAGFGGASGNYNSDQLDIDITEDISGTGWKGIRFDTDLRCRIAAIIECKLDITA